MEHKILTCVNPPTDVIVNLTILILRTKPVAYRGGGCVFKPPPPKFRRPSKILPNSTRLVKTVKNC